MMIGQRTKVWLSLAAVAVLVCSAVLVFFVAPLQRSFAQASALTVNDFYTQGGSWDPWGTTSDSSGHIWVAMPGCDPSPYCGSTTPGQILVYNPPYNSWIKTYQLPANFAQPLFLAIDKQGRVWFPEPANNSLGMLDPSTNTFSQWAVPTASSGPWGVAIDAGGKIWFTEHYVNQIGSFDPSTSKFTEVATTAANTQPYGITVDASNNIWFTENNSAVAEIGEYTAQGVLKEYKIRTGSTAGLTPHLITTDHTGNVWWTEGWVGMLGKLNIAAAVPGTNNSVVEYAYQHLCASCSTHTSGISVAASGQVWFTDSLQSIFGSFDSSSNAFTLYNTPTTNSHPHDGLSIDAANNLWFTEEFANKMAHGVLPSTGSSTPTPASTVAATSTSVATATPVVTATSTSTPVAGATLGQDTFLRANQAHWGTASDGHVWAGDANTTSAFSISSNVGKVANAGGSYSAVLGSTATKADVVFTGSISSFSNSNFGSVLRWTDANNWYKAYLDGASLIIQKKVAGTTTVLVHVPFVAAAGTSYTIHFQAVGTTLNASVWATSSKAPAAWMATATDAALTSGYAGLRIQALGSTFTVTSFKAIALA